MAIYAVQALYAAGCLVNAYCLYRDGLNPSFLSNPEIALTDGKIQDFVRSKANQVLTRKEISAFVATVYAGQLTEEVKNEFINAQAKLGAHTKDEINDFVSSLVDETLHQETYDEFVNSQANGALTGSKIKRFVSKQAKKMGIEKEIVVIQRDYYSSSGNTWFSGMACVELSGKPGETSWKFSITHQIAHIKANDHLIMFGAVLATAIFTTFVLAVNRDLFTRYLGGIVAGFTTGVYLARRSERRADVAAMQSCSKKVNQAYLDRLLKEKNEKVGDLRSWIGDLKQSSIVDWVQWLRDPSLDERIGYCQAHINAT
jgi:hypothetical protein